MKMFFLAERKVGLKGVKQQVCWEITVALSGSNSSPSHVDITWTSMTQAAVYCWLRELLHITGNPIVA